MYAVVERVNHKKHSRVRGRRAQPQHRRVWVERQRDNRCRRRTLPAFPAAPSSSSSPLPLPLPPPALLAATPRPVRITILAKVLKKKKRSSATQQQQRPQQRRERRTNYGWDRSEARRQERIGQGEDGSPPSPSWPLSFLRVKQLDVQYFCISAMGETCDALRNP